MSLNREWMYGGWIRNGRPTTEFYAGVEEFVQFAKQHEEGCVDNLIRCPCKKKSCQNKKFLNENDLRMHLYRNGFVEGYHRWIYHGETTLPVQSYVPVQIETAACSASNEYVDPMRAMIYEAGGPNIFSDYGTGEHYNNDDDMDTEFFAEDQQPNPAAQGFYDLINAADQPLWDGCDRHSLLSASFRMLELKCRHGMSEACFNDVSDAMHEMQPSDTKLPKDWYSTKKLVKEFGLPVEVIHCCVSGCMLYWGEDSELDKCKFCGHNRYRNRGGGTTGKRIPVAKMHYFSIIPRLQRLYNSKATASHMRWHAEHETAAGKMEHPSDSEAWKYFDRTHTDFASEPRNVRLALCSDGFQAFGQFGQQYSSWPVLLTPYNLPPNLCMKDEMLFLTCLVPGPRSPKAKMDVYLQPLIKELQLLWDEGVHTYDISMEQNFQMRAALMWTINDFPAYGMLSGWSTSGYKACPHCIEEPDSFYLPESKKISWFDCHRKFLDDDHPFRVNRTGFKKGIKVSKRFEGYKSGDEILDFLNSVGYKEVTEMYHEETNIPLSKQYGWNRKNIFWRLPYWKDHILRHNIDPMHTEKNFFDNLFFTMMDVRGKSKDTANSRKELNDICGREDQNMIGDTNRYPKIVYQLTSEQKKAVLEWVRMLKFPDGYASNMARCIDIGQMRMFGMKSHDCHVFMQRLMPIAFKEVLPKDVWEAITEISLFFKHLTTSSITVDDMTGLDRQIPITLCKLERIFPPSFFDSMEHITVHLAYEAKMCGPVQYRWMYPFERYLRRLKKKITNKYRVDGSIAKAYLLEEAAKFASYYFGGGEPEVPRPIHRNSAQLNINEDQLRLSVFQNYGRTSGKRTICYLDNNEYVVARKYVILNTPEVAPYLE